MDFKLYKKRRHEAIDLKWMSLAWNLTIQPITWPLSCPHWLTKWLSNWQQLFSIAKFPFKILTTRHSINSLNNTINQKLIHATTKINIQIIKHLTIKHAYSSIFDWKLFKILSKLQLGIRKSKNRNFLDHKHNSCI